MMGRQKLVEYEQHGRALVEDGHVEGRMLLELLQEVKRLLSVEWSPEGLRDALDTTMALYLGSKEGRAKGLRGTSVLELQAWLGAEAIRLQAEGMPAIARKAASVAPDPLRQLLDDEPDAELLARAQQEREVHGDGVVRPFVRELRERGRVTAAEWAVPMNGYERRELLRVLVDSVFIEHLLHGAGNVEPGSPGTYNWALVHENVPEALRRWRGYLRELVVRQLDERLEHPGPFLHDAALAYARADNHVQMRGAIGALLSAAEAYSKVLP